MSEINWIELDAVLVNHTELILETGGLDGVLNRGALESTLAKPQNYHYYNDESDLFTLAALYGYGLIKNHCFIDGNKRIAFVVTYTFLLINGIHLRADQSEAAKFFWELAASLEAQDVEIRNLAHWLQDHSEPLTD